MSSVHFLRLSHPRFHRHLGAKKDVKLKPSAFGNDNRAAAAAEAATKYVPYIPPNLVAETVKFLESRSNIQLLLNIICAPREPKENAQQREEFTRKWEMYEERKRLFNRPYRDQEKLVELSLWRAVNSLPSDLYPEAVQESSQTLPLELRPHYLYRAQIMKSMTDYEERKLQVFQNLMYLRFPFNDTKKKSPGWFWISQLGAINRSRIAKLGRSIVSWRK